MDNFPYQRILITGATAGIGQALASRILESSTTAHVIAVGRRKDVLESLVETHGPGRVTAEQFDVSDIAGLPKWTKSITERFPDLDAVILNAGWQHMPKIAQDPASVDLGKITEELHTNYLSPVHTSTLFLPHLQQHDRPSAIIFVSSGLALVPSILCPTYSAGKAAIHSFAWTLRANLGPVSPHIRVAEIIPPAVQTELHTNQGLPQMGMELGEFLEQAWEGLAGGLEEIPVGSVKDRVKKIEVERREMFKEMTEMMREQRKKMQGSQSS